VRYVEDATINEYMLFYRHKTRRATAKELFKIVDDFMEAKSMRWLHCVGVCTATARVMAGNKGLRALIK
jgi:hypothetical protein